jgi:Holliday junction resolvase
VNRIETRYLKFPIITTIQSFKNNEKQKPAMSRKSKGMNAEREIVHLFRQAGWAPLRVAGSGSARMPCPDVIAGNGIRRVAIEAKSSKKDSIYIPIDEIRELERFALLFGSEAWIGVRFNNQPWFFLRPIDTKITEKSYAITLNLAKEKGGTFDDLIKTKDL